MKELRPHQSLAIDMLRASLRSGKRRVILKAPVAFGKTLTAAEITKSAQAKGKRVTFIVDAISLIDQTVRAFYDQGIHSIGVIQADHMMTDWRKPIQIASVQSLESRKMPKSDLVIVDECHGQRRWLYEIMNDPEWCSIPFVGLSATPFSKGLGRHWDDLLVPATMRYLMEAINPDTGRPYMSGYKAFEPHSPDTKGIKTVGGDFHQGQASSVMGQDSLIADAVEWWKREGRDEPTITFCHDKAHAQKIQERYLAAGIGWGYIDDRTERADREIIRKKLEAREIYGVASVGTLIKGIDWPIGCISWLCMTKSKTKLVQGDGRGLRDNENVGVGVGGCIFLDHGGNHARLGYPEDIDDAFSDLCTKEQSEKAESSDGEKPVPLPKKCPKCSRLRPIGSNVCPSCGFEAKVISKIEEAPGILVEKRRTDPTEVQRFYSELLGYARAKDKKDGWAFHQCRRKFGESVQIPRSEPSKPSPATISWVTAMNIRRAKGMAK